MQARDRLLSVGLELFVRRGYDAVGVQEIVTRAGVTKPTLYHHFGSKRGLLDALAGLVGERLFGLFGDEIRYRRDLARDLEDLIDALIRFARLRPAEARLFLAAQNGPVDSETRQALAPVWDRLSGSIGRLFGDASVDHGNMRGRSDEYTVAFLGTACAYMVRVLDGRMPDEPSLAHRIMRHFSYGIYT